MESKANAAPYFSAAQQKVATVDWRSYFQMTKPTISMLVVVTVIPSLFMAANGVPPFFVALAALLGTFGASASASIFNHLVDSDIDQVMKRTRLRPIPSGKVSSSRAFAMAVILGLFSFGILYQATTPLAAWISVAANVFYVVIYTMFLKRRTVQNIVIGGAAGAVGPLIGWAAITGHLAWPAWALFWIIFLWTPPHFWALAIKYKDDYARVGVPMLPAVKGLEATRRQIFAYTLTLIPPVVSLYWFGVAGGIYAVLATLMTAYFIWLAFKLLVSRENQRAMPLFYYSCFYLFGVFGALAIDRLVYLL